VGVVRQVKLFFQEGNSDKLYEAEIVVDADGSCSVVVRWGPRLSGPANAGQRGNRGQALNTGKKAQSVTRAAADKIFDKLVREKTGKGYEIQTEDHVPAAVAPPEGAGSSSKSGVNKRAVVGPKAQLMNPVDDDAHGAALLRDDSWFAQQKLDGQRVLLNVQAGTQSTFGTNRHGEKTNVPDAVVEGASFLPPGTILDGELLDDAYLVFDVLALGGEDLRALSGLERWQRLSDEVEPGLSEPVSVVAVAITTKQKQALHKRLVSKRAEGIVFKRTDAAYRAGRGSTQLKWKFLKSADVVVVENAGNAYRMQVKHNGKWFDVGKVFAGTTNASRAQLDQILKDGTHPVCEVQYLYASADFQLVQPVFVRIRDDKAASDCSRDQLVQTNKEIDDAG
jgi:bifunctional non-homologous end joining protein LigD